MARHCFVLAILALATPYVHGAHDCNKYPTLEESISCCSVPHVIPRSIWRNCFPDKDHESQPEQFCSGHCLFVEKGLIKDGELDYPAINMFFKDFIKNNATWASVVDTVLGGCTELIKNRDLKQLSNYHCASKADYYVHCAHNNVIYSCPDEYWSPDTKCQERKLIVQNCPLPEIVAKPFTLHKENQ